MGVAGRLDRQDGMTFLPGGTGHVAQRLFAAQAYGQDLAGRHALELGLSCRRNYTATASRCTLVQHA